MSRRAQLGALTLAGGGVVAVLGLHQLVPPEVDAPASPSTALSEPPAPTPGPRGGLEQFLDEKADQRTRRKQWFAEMHRAAPGVDWKAEELANGLALQAWRNDLALGLVPPPPHTEGTWVERGSDNQSGSMHVGRLVSDGTLYTGSDRGGVWRGAEEGNDWEPIGDSLYGGAHWLEITTQDDGSHRILAGTNGGLLHYSEDGGATWQTPSGLPALESIRRLTMTSDGSETVFLVAKGDDGTRLYRSQDGGLSFEDLHGFGGFAGDAWVPRDGETDLWLVDSEGIQLSEDLGESFELVSTLPKGSRAELAISEAGGFYVVMDGRTLFFSDDGESWEGRGTISDYWGALNASIDDPDLFAYGGVELWISRDAGQSFRKKNDWWTYYTVYGGDERTQLHADIMGVDVQTHPESGDELWYVHTHGGTYVSEDALERVDNLSLDGHRVSQYYDVHTSWADPDHVVAGAQDQGYQVTAGVTQDEDDALEFYQIVSGDYGHISSSDGSHDFLYSTYPGFILIQVGEDAAATESADFPSGESYVPWIPPVIADPEQKDAVFFPATRIYRYERDDGWRAREYSAGVPMADDEYISAMAFSPVDPQRVYIATSSGKIHHSEDKALTFTRSESLGPDDNWYYGQAIAPSWTDPDVVTIGGSGYGVPGVYRSEDGGETFKPWADGLPSTMVYGLVEAMDGSGCLFAGTEKSAYQRCPDDDAWLDITDGLAPITTYWSVEALPHENTIRFGTYGRGIWDFQMETPDCYPVEDADGDGFWCDQDCDDASAAAYPGAEEIVGDGIDQDCDGSDLTEEEGGDDTGPSAGDDTDVPPVEIGPAGCGCGSVPAQTPWGALVMLLGAGLLWRRRS